MTQIKITTKIPLFSFSPSHRRRRPSLNLHANAPSLSSSVTNVSLNLSAMGLPDFLFDSHKRYKADTNRVAAWLAETAQKYGHM